MAFAAKLVFLFLSLGLLGYAVKDAPQSVGGVNAADDGNPYPPKP